MIAMQGWLPPSRRDADQMRLTYEYHERIGRFSQRANRLASQPERVIMAEVEILALGQLLPRIKQLTGSCVGAGGERARCLAMCGDVVRRKSREDVKIAFPFAAYGIGRKIAGMRGRGDGSFGAAQAKAFTDFGTLPFDHRMAPAPTIRNGWAFWSERVEYDWSWPAKWPIAEREVATEAKPYDVEDGTQLNSTEDLKEALAQLCGVTIACPYIPTNRTRVVGDMLVDDFTARGGHQQCVSGYWDHPSAGLHFLIDNQWDDVHGHCPTLFPLGVTGSYWVPATRVDRIIRGGDCELYAFSGTGDFHLPEIDHGTGGL